MGRRTLRLAERLTAVAMTLAASTQLSRSLSMPEGLGPFPMDNPVSSLLDGRSSPQAGRRKPRQAGLAKVPGLFAVARHSGLRSLLASDSARRTPAASRSV